MRFANQIADSMKSFNQIVDLRRYANKLADPMKFVNQLADMMRFSISIHGKENSVFPPTVLGRMVLVGNEEDSITLGGIYVKSYDAFRSVCRHDSFSLCE